MNATAYLLVCALSAAASAAPAAPTAADAPEASAQAAAPAAPSAALPGDSVYLLADRYTGHDGRDFTLLDRRGRPQLVAMFYTSCGYVCPLIVDSAKGVEHALDAEAREGLDILLVSIDPARDDVAALRGVVERRKLDPTRWTLARTDEAGVRRLAAVLDVRYRALADGEFNHTSSLVLLDRDGRKLATTTQLGAVPAPDFLAAVRAALATPPHD
jgi:protein SCO1/2